MEANSIMIALTIISIIVIFTGPLAAVLVGQYLQDRKKKYGAKLNLLLTLISHRSNRVHPDFVMALNQIDLVYYDCQTVLFAWHKHYENFCKPDSSGVLEERRRSFLDLVQEMADSLGYHKLKQTDVDKVYYPIAHETRDMIDAEMKTQLLGFLKGGNEFFEMIKEKSEAQIKKASSGN